MVCSSGQIESPQAKTGATTPIVYHASQVKRSNHTPSVARLRVYCEWKPICFPRCMGLPRTHTPFKPPPEMSNVCGKPRHPPPTVFACSCSCRTRLSHPTTSTRSWSCGIATRWRIFGTRRGPTWCSWSGVSRILAGGGERGLYAGSTRRWRTLRL